MDVFSIITLVGGLAFFLYGMNVMSNGLERMTGGKLERALRRLTANKWKALLLGAGITIAIQSSSAMTVMLVGFVNSGIMELGQTIGIIMGSNIGTTLTAWILSLSGIESDTVFIKLLNPESFAPILAMIGIVMIMVSKKQKKRDMGNILVGFSILMFGMNLMSDAVSPLADVPEFRESLVAFKNPFLGVAVGAIFTGIIQSSAASVGILQALSLTGGISYAMALPIIMGQNIGTCVTALLSSIGVNKNAKRVAVVHIYFNVIGTFVFLVAIYGGQLFYHFSFLDRMIGPVGIAAVHSIFNIVTTLLLFPFASMLEKMAMNTIKDTKKEEQLSFLDERLLATPSMAIGECEENMAKVANLVQTTVETAFQSVLEFSKEAKEEVVINEKKIDQSEDNLGTFLVKLSSKQLSEKDSKEVSKILHIIGDFERMSDHALNLVNISEQIEEMDGNISEKAKAELCRMIEAMKEIVNNAIKAYLDKDLSLAKKIEPLEEVIDLLEEDLNRNHVERLKSGECKIEQGLLYRDILNNLERISDHCSNIAVCLIQINESSFDTHQYLRGIRKAENVEFINYYLEYKSKYQLE